MIIRAPQDDSEVGVCTLSTPEDVRAALDASVAAARPCRELPAYERARALRATAAGLTAERDGLARTLALEAGKPISQANRAGPGHRGIRGCRRGSHPHRGRGVAGRLRTDGKGRLALTRRFPLAPITGITPFNFPVLLTAHKVAPAMACGATITIKPPPQDPLATLRLMDIIRSSGYPTGGVNMVPCHVEVAQILIEDPRVRLITFTGSAAAG